MSQPQSDGGQWEVLTESLRSLYLSTQHTDITIQTTETEYYLHRLVLCLQSKYFERLFDGDWMETKENIISLMDDDYETVESMIRFMYGHEYWKIDEKDSAFLHVSVYSLADKYDIPALRNQARMNFERVLDAAWDHEDLLDFIPQFYSQFSHTHGTLLDPFVDKFAYYFSHAMTLDGFKKALDDVPRFAHDVMEALAKNHTTKWEVVRCSGCNRNAFIPPARGIHKGEGYCDLCTMNYQAHSDHAHLNHQTSWTAPSLEW